MQFSIGFPLPHHPLDLDMVTPDFVAEFARVAEASGF
jgi:hypothetical protein